MMCVTMSASPSTTTAASPSRFVTRGALGKSRGATTTTMATARGRVACAAAAASKPWKARDCRLVLEDGSVWPGKAFGAQGTQVGEVVFNTSLSGYVDDARARALGFERERAFKRERARGGVSRARARDRAMCDDARWWSTRWVVGVW